MYLCWENFKDFSVKFVPGKRALCSHSTEVRVQLQRYAKIRFDYTEDTGLLYFDRASVTANGYW